MSDWSSTENLIKCLLLEGNTKQVDVLSIMINRGKPAEEKKGKKQGFLATYSLQTKQDEVPITLMLFSMFGAELAKTIQSGTKLD